jgi:hypothetical protein
MFAFKCGPLKLSADTQTEFAPEIRLFKRQWLVEQLNNNNSNITTITLITIII